MFPLIIALGLLWALSEAKSSETPAGGSPKGWSILLQGPAALPQAAAPELARAFGIRTIKTAFLSSPRLGYNVFTVVTPDVILARVGQTVNVMGVPLTVRSIQPAPIS